jgi:hypothetical protein
VKVLVTGKGGNTGSWKIRGEQLGEALGAAVVPMASLEDCFAADVIVVVKRTPEPLMAAVRRSGKPWVLDMVDGWPQPCTWDKGQSIAWLKQRLHALTPHGVIFGTDAMRTDAMSRAWGETIPEYPGPGLILPHHSWDKYTMHKPVVRDEVRVVGYEGVPEYLGRWRPIVEKECAARGWQFQINGDMRQADIGVALRDGGGYPARWWKPGTKLSNLHALGIPALCTREAGYQSVASGAEFWIEEDADVGAVFNLLADRHARKLISDTMRSALIWIEDVAEDYRGWLNALV